MFRAMSKGEIPEVTSLVYHARENALELLKKEAQALGAERVVGNKLLIQELSPGLIEVVAIGTALRREAGMEPATPALLPQAIIVDRDSLDAPALSQLPGAQPVATRPQVRSSRAGCIIGIIYVVMMFVIGIAVMISKLAAGTGHHH
jgi:hypothetical protein